MQEVEAISKDITKDISTGISKGINTCVSKGISKIKLAASTIADLQAQLEKSGLETEQLKAQLFETAQLAASKDSTIADLQAQLEKPQVAAAVQPDSEGSQLAGGGDNPGVVALLTGLLADKSGECKQHL
jgi:septal ring factor EnvC (AmiA/AmiB activator)